MSVKHFCDICERECRDKVGDRFKAGNTKLSFEIIVAVNGVWNGGTCCINCLMDKIEEEKNKYLNFFSGFDKGIV